MNVPIRGYGDHDLISTCENPIYFEKTFPLGYKPPKDSQSLKEAQMDAKMLRAVVSSESAGMKVKCKFHCDTDFGGKNCIPADLTVTCPARTSKRLPTLDIEWVGDTGSTQDLTSERDLAGMSSRDSSHPINIMTANGPSSADKQFAVNVPSIGIASDPYVLPDTPAVLSVGQRCVEEGFDFVWESYSRPYLKTPKGEKVYLDVRDNVPYLKSWPENVALPASRSAGHSVQTAAERKGPAPDESESTAKRLTQEEDYSNKSCLELIPKVKFKGPGAQRSAVTSSTRGPITVQRSMQF